MEGFIVNIDGQEGYGFIETNNRNIGRIRFYLNAIAIKEGIDVGQTVSFEVARDYFGRQCACDVSLVQRNTVWHNTEDRQVWYEEGERFEHYFVENLVPRMGLDLIVNPEKERKPYVIDLLDLGNGKYADLKTQTTPFFSAGRYKYKKTNRPYDPAFTFTFNEKDYQNYKEHYPDIDIYVYVNWMQLEHNGFSVAPVNGVWRAPFEKMAEAIENGKLVLHAYDHRINDDKNARSSYLFDLNDIEIFERLL